MLSSVLYGMYIHTALFILSFYLYIPPGCALVVGCVIQGGCAIIRVVRYVYTYCIVHSFVLSICKYWGGGSTTELLLKPEPHSSFRDKLTLIPSNLPPKRDCGSIKGSGNFDAPLPSTCAFLLCIRNSPPSIACTFSAQELPKTVLFSR